MTRARGLGLMVCVLAALSMSAFATMTGTSEVLVFFEPGADTTALALQAGLSFQYSLKSADAAVFRADSAEAAAQFVRTAASRAGVRSAYLNDAAGPTTSSFVPNDPYFHKETPTEEFSGQWYLKNEYTPGLDAGVEAAWNRNLTGAGVVIGIVDTGFETTHPDLAPNYNAADSWDFALGIQNPDPKQPEDIHGTAVAGIAAARGGNGIGITGTAPYASLAGLRCDFTVHPTVAQFVDATLYHSSGANTSITIKNHSYGYGAWESRAAEEAALETSASAGTIHVFAAGNDYRQDANKRALANSPYAITVSAVGSDGILSSYSNIGANVFVCAPSSSWSWPTDVTTTDRMGSAGYNPDHFDSFPDDNYTSVFTGTSAAAPIVSGVLALGKQVRPNLDVRFAKHLLARSSTLVDPDDAYGDSPWETNAAGFSFNRSYGFGLINADKFTELAEFYLAVTPLVVEDTGLTNVDKFIPDGDLDGLSRTFEIATDGKLEEVLVTLDIDHTYRGDLEAYLTSPSGTTRLLFKHFGADSGDNIVWTFLTNAFWGENSAGTWALQVCDVYAVYGDVGFWNSFSVEVRTGDVIPEPATTGLLLLGAATLAAVRRRRVSGGRG